MKPILNKRCRAILTTGVGGVFLLTGCRSGGRPDETATVRPTAAAIADSIRMSTQDGPGTHPRGSDLEATVGTTGYVIGPDDVVQIRTFGAESLSGEMRVTSGGAISVPLLGSVKAAGLTPPELEAVIERRLDGTFMKDPAVSVQVIEMRARTVYVVGEVIRPGGFPLTGSEPISVLQALALAGGLGPTAAQGSTLIYRTGEGGNRQEISVDLEKVLDGSIDDPLLRPRDILFVPNSRTKSFARGVLDAFVRMFTLRGILY